VQFSSEKKVLSLYLDTDLAHRSKDAIKLLFRERIKSLEEPPPKSDIQAIEKYLDFEYDWQARGLAIFASGQELWEAFPLPIPVRTQAFFTEKPYVRVLSDVLDRFGKYGVALIDRESVRLFSVAWGRIQSETESFGEELKRHKQGGWASARYQRHEDNLALHNLKQAVEITQAFCEQTDCQRLMLGGSKEMLAQVVELMPSHMRAKVIGEFAADMEASPNEILSHTLDVAYQVDLEEEKRIVSEVVTAAAKGGAGVIGLADTPVLRARRDDRGARRGESGDPQGDPDGRRGEHRAPERGARKGGEHRRRAAILRR
jgi:peptide chain release factor subunit 1